MCGPPRERPLYLPAERPTSFTVVHEPVGAPTGLGVLFCAPFGWDDVASYRARRVWAMALAASGHLVLRSDAPGSGDSAGAPTDPRLLDAWCATVRDCECWLREAGSRRVAAIGLGLGGLVALEALTRGTALDDVVLWGVPPGGRPAVRRLRASSRLQADRLTEPSTGLPDGWLEVNGHLVTAETQSALGAVDLPAVEPGSGRRILILERPGVSADRRLAGALGEAGADVDRASGPGYDEMVDHPQTSREPFEVITTVSRWLETASIPDARPPGASQADATALPLPATGACETPVTIAHAGGVISGILTTPVRACASGIGAVFFNAGAIRRVGPNRLWVETARAWAGSGVTSLRLDLDGIGDSGSPYGQIPAPALYGEDRLEQGRMALDWIAGRLDVERVITVGLCAGGRVAFQLAARDRRVVAAVVTNSTALTWDRNLVVTDMPPSPRLLLRPDYLRGSAEARRAMPRDIAYWTVTTVRREATFRRTRRRLERLLDAAGAQGTRVVLALNEGEPEQLRLVSARNRARLRRWPHVLHAPISSSDHALRPIPAQRQLRRILDECLTMELSRHGGSRDHRPVPLPSSTPVSSVPMPAAMPPDTAARPPLNATWPPQGSS